MPKIRRNPIIQSHEKPNQTVNLFPLIFIWIGSKMSFNPWTSCRGKKSQKNLRNRMEFSDICDILTPRCKQDCFDDFVNLQLKYGDYKVQNYICMRVFNRLCCFYVKITIWRCRKYLIPIEVLRLEKSNWNLELESHENLHSSPDSYNWKPLIPHLSKKALEETDQYTIRSPGECNFFL